MFLFAEGALHDSAGVVDDGAPAFIEFGWLGNGAVFEVVFDVAEDPWIAEGGAAEPGRLSTRASATDAIVLAVYMPPHAPGPGHASLTTERRSASSIWPVTYSPYA